MIYTTGPSRPASLGTGPAARRLRARLPGAGGLHALPPRDHVNVALCVPLGGSAGIWAPSALASARLAVAELNRGDGIAGRPVRLLTVNAADDAPDIEATLAELIDGGEIDAMVGMHTSAVRQRVLRAVGGQIPFVYTPLYEGGEATPGVFAIGETTERQLQLALGWLAGHRRPKRWLAVGNDYIWPRAAHQMARPLMAAHGGELVAENYVPFGTDDFSAVLAQVRRHRADAVLVSLIGQDAVAFNRAFGRAGLARQALRLSCALGENELLGIGAANTDDLYVACGYFASLDTEANLAFSERYRQLLGARAPTLDTFGQSTYEGLHFLAALFDAARQAPDTRWDTLAHTPLDYRSARGTDRPPGDRHPVPMYLATAGDNRFHVITRL
jgi:ABC-type branched-subunit amino acid transport system substrate-binding protein